MIPTISTEELDESNSLTLYSSIYAYSALMEKYDETPLDELVQVYYSLAAYL